MSDVPLTGGCLCGAVRFELAVAPHDAGYCHCTHCQQRTGTAASAQALIDGSALTFTAGEELVTRLDPAGRRDGEVLLPGVRRAPAQPRS